MSRSWWLWLPIACWLAAGCGGSSSTEADLRAQVSSVAMFHLSGITSDPATPAPASPPAVTDPAAAQDAARAILDLPPAPADRSDCPADLGVAYSVIFNAPPPGETLMAGRLELTGCELARMTIDGAHFAHFSAAGQPEFWSRLARDLGVAASDLHPYSPPP